MRALDTLRDLRNQRVAELARMIRAGGRVVRYSPLWRARLRPLLRETANAGHLDLLAGSCLTLTRAVTATNRVERRMLAAPVRALADTLADLAAEPGDHRVRQHAADCARDVARGLPNRTTSDAPVPASALMALRMVIADIMVFAGVDPAHAVQVVQEGTGQLQVPPPARTLHLPFRLTWRRRKR